MPTLTQTPQDTQLYTLTTPVRNLAPGNASAIKVTVSKLLAYSVP
ncbi:MAG: hypothetical protein AAF215_22705 [Cyanobacteria bacterium P01_A01_bin.123]